jgi:UDPglucose--hexose-1-phosphate uridylyltransferase
LPELRKDPITGRWVIISTDRSKRPSDFAREPDRKMGSMCPFCPGNEDKTPPEILAYRSNGASPNKPGWNVRVVPNKFPALGIEGTMDKRAEGLFDRMNGIGAHEVIIETPEHNEKMAQYSEKRLEDVCWAFRDRMMDLKKDKRFRYILIFKNSGEAAGASLEHPHSQLIALPIVPKRVQEEVDGSKQYFNMKERCIYCDIIRQELNSKIRIVDQNEGFLTLAPYAPRFPFETWILPLEHESAFENAQSRMYESLAKAMKSLMSRVDKVLEGPPYNFVIHTSPLNDANNDYYHWHIEMMPKLTKVAGFEWGTGFYINPTPPEESANFLREASVGVAK